MKLLYIVNEPKFFLSHRLPLAVEALRHGYEVHVATMDGEGVDEIKGYGFFHHSIPLSRSGGNIFKECASFFSILRLILSISPNLLHLVTIKPVLYGGVASRLLKVDGVVVAISGLGHVFSSQSIKASLIRTVLRPLFNFALNHKNARAIFQNPDDKRVLEKQAKLDGQNSVMIRGSGVNLDHYKYNPEHSGRPRVIFAARLLKPKGVEEFVAAARILRKKGLEADFVLAGEPDPGNPESVTVQKINSWKREEVVDVVGFCANISEVFSKSHIVVLPSYYGEGLPKVLIEAAACGRAVVTTDHPGCRDAIDEGRTGLLVPIKDEVALANAIEYLIVNKEVRQSYGVNGRALAGKEFSITKVVADHMAIYDELSAFIK